MKNVASWVGLCSLALTSGCFSIPRADAGDAADAVSEQATDAADVADSGTDAVDAATDVSSVTDADDAATDSGVDSGADSGADSGVDSGADTGIDTGADSGADSGIDSGIDSGVDSGVDAGIDSGACGAGEMRCGASCVDTTTNAAHCGACGRTCAATERCAGGTCECITGLTRCGTACVNLTGDTAHCGMCSRACPTGASCTTSACVCPSGQTDCGGACTDTDSSPTNCGACGRTCGAMQTCVGGTCRCTSPLLLCGTSCADPRTDVANCGACGTMCPLRANSTPLCSARVCGVNCNNGYGNCNLDPTDGCEVNLAAANNNCGSCGTSCVAGSCSAAGCGSWARMFGDELNQVIRAITSDGDGNVYIGGFASGASSISGGVTMGSSGAGQFAFVVSYTRTGTYRWHRTFSSGSTSDDLTALTARGTGLGSRLVGVGRVGGTTMIDGFTITGTAMYVMEFNTSNGAVRWVRGSPASGTPVPHDVAISPLAAGEVYVVGELTGTLALDSASVSSSSGSEAFVLRLSNTGTGAIIRTAGHAPGGLLDRFTDVEVDSLGSVIVAGGLHYPATISQMPMVVDSGAAGRGMDVAVVGYDRNLDYVRHRMFGGSQSDSSASMTLAGATESVAIATLVQTGYTVSRGGDPATVMVPSATGNSQGVVIMLDNDPSFTPAWAHAIASTNAPTIGGVVSLPGTNRLFYGGSIGGVFTVAGTMFTTPAFGTPDYFIAELNPVTGAEIAGAQYGGAMSENANFAHYGRQLAACGSNAVCLGGFLNGNSTGATATSQIGAAALTGGLRQDGLVFRVER